MKSPFCTLRKRSFNVAYSGKAKTQGIGTIKVKNSLVNLFISKIERCMYNKLKNL